MFSFFAVTRKSLTENPVVPYIRHALKINLNSTARKKNTSHLKTIVVYGSWCTAVEGDKLVLYFFYLVRWTTMSGLERPLVMPSPQKSITRHSWG